MVIVERIGLYKPLVKEDKLKGHGFSAIYVLNIIFQAIFTMVWHIGILLLICFLTVRFLSAPEWLYAPAILIGVGSGFYSMVRFIITACRSLDRIEEERIQRSNSRGKSNRL